MDAIPFLETAEHFQGKSILKGLLSLIDDLKDGERRNEQFNIITQALQKTRASFLSEVKADFHHLKLAIQRMGKANVAIEALEKRLGELEQAGPPIACSTHVGQLEHQRARDELEGVLRCIGRI